MDLKSLDSVAASNEGASMTLMHPVSGEALDIQVVLYGPDSDTVRRLKREQGDRALASLRKPGKRSSEDIERASAVFLASATKGWTNLKEGDVEVPFSFENAVRIYMAYPWMREQVDRFIGDRGNFIKG